MACNPDRPDPAVLFTQIKDMFSVNVLGGSDVIPESNEWYVVSNDYAAAELYYGYADQMRKEMDPQTACCENLIAMAAKRGVFPYAAEYAQGYVRLNGTPGANLPLSIQITTTQGNYASVGTVPGELDSQGTAVIRVQAVLPGAAGNSGGVVTTGSLGTPIAGVNNAVEICGGLFCGGAEAEECEAFRQRYLNRLTYKPRATQSWMMEKLAEWPCATRVCQRSGTCCKCVEGCGDCGCRDCGGRFEYYVMFDGVFPCGIPPANIVEDINVWMFGENPGYGEGQAEIGICGQVITPNAIMLNLILDIVGCISSAQQSRIEANIRDLFLQLCPSQIIKSNQVRVAIADVIGAAVDVDVQYEFVNPADEIHLSISDCCGDIEPDCDYMPCINQIFVNSSGNGAGSC